MDNNDKERILGIIDKIVEKSSDGKCIYRGQSDVAHIHAESTLYRAMGNCYGEIKEEKWLDMNQVQKAALKNARRFATEDYDNKKMLSHIQHYSGNTNLIDFTKDYFVALFFACNQKYSKEDGADGNIFLLKISKLNNSKKNKIIDPIYPLNRVIAQKSVFVQSRTGFIFNAEMDAVIMIPRDLKVPILRYLEKQHDISLSTIYNDLHGYIRSSEERDNAVMKFYMGLIYRNKSDKLQLLAEKKNALEKAIKYYCEAILLDPKYVDAYIKRGQAKFELMKISE